MKIITNDLAAVVVFLKPYTGELAAQVLQLLLALFVLSVPIRLHCFSVLVLFLLKVGDACREFSRLIPFQWRMLVSFYSILGTDAPDQRLAPLDIVLMSL